MTDAERDEIKAVVREAILEMARQAAHEILNTPIRHSQTVPADRDDAVRIATLPFLTRHHTQ